MNVVDVKSDDKDKKDGVTAQEVTAEDLLWMEFLKTLDKLEKGVEGDLSALGRATRNLNRFRKRLPSTTWLRIVYTVIPSNYRAEFISDVSAFITDMTQQKIAMIAALVGVTADDATQKLQGNNGDVFLTLMSFVAEKERLAKVEIKKKQQRLKQERLEREKKKGVVTEVSEEGTQSKQDTAAATVAKSASDGNAMDVDKSDETAADQTSASATADDKDDVDEIKITLIPLKDRRQKRKFYPETYVFLKLLIALELYDRGQFAQSLPILAALIAFSKQQNRRTSDLLSLRLYQFYALCTQRLSHEQSSSSSSSSSASSSLWSIRAFLFSEYKTACLQQNESAQSQLIVLILQCYIASNLYSLAHKFVEKAEFPESAESPIFARYHYYRGRIDCVQLQYADSLYHVQQALRRAPQTACYGFKLNATRWLIVVQLLMGDIPDRNLFKPKFDGNLNVNHPELNEALAPFLEITECVREGDLNRYQQCLTKFAALFAQCGVSKILLRLRHNVIKTGLRKLNKSYSRISLHDIADKLRLSSAENAYFIVCKAIRDGVINAKVDYAQKFVESKENVNVYNTAQPYVDYAQRIKFCLDIRNSAVKNLRYPAQDGEEEDKNKKKDGDDDDEALTAEEIAEMIQKHHDEDDEDDD
eukprot:CAMPEP_0202709240 /NCGR_PEP_ID=MMETSP1385-20130828/21361_1 /ASSEMBLY_ACC=CAM_ASM_000861 /TAXON_ID=933848 /ORGANISM="Elphidium margaritaceum" /LENGTH=645 /DNA_ID=CAMNT_0049368437 /DNA_START=151 /DNA_END=2088 /DNA_ORIENTATION=-